MLEILWETFIQPLDTFTCSLCNVLQHTVFIHSEDVLKTSAVNHNIVAVAWICIYVHIYVIHLYGCIPTNTTIPNMSAEIYVSFGRSSKLLQHNVCSAALAYVWIRNALTAQVFSECVPHVGVEETLYTLYCNI